MKTLILTIPFFITNLICSAQVDNQIIKSDSGNYCAIQPGMPSFPGGNEKLYQYINQNFSDSLIKPGTDGKVFLQITVDKTGQLTKLKVLHGINSTLDKEMIRVFSIMPKWIPAEKNGEKVDVEFVIPIKVSYQSSNK